MQSLYRLHKRKRGLLTLPKIEKRLEICKSCINFTGEYCKLCRCCVNEHKTFFNKIAYPTERCPDNPPKWNVQ